MAVALRAKVSYPNLNKTLKVIPGAAQSRSRFSSATGSIHPAIRGSGSMKTVYLNSAHFSRYQMLYKIGHGGMAEVWLASDLQNNGNKVAIKFPNDGHFLFHCAVLKERRILKELNGELGSPFPKCYYPEKSELESFSGLEGNYVAMEFIPGPILRALINEEEALPLHRIIDLVMQLCGLQRLHEHGYVHADLKPENIIVTNEEKATILDLGLACLIGKRGRGGSIGYRSPEQIREQILDERTDIYSLGVIFYEMITKESTWALDSEIKNGIRLESIKERFEDAKETLEAGEREKLEKQVATLQHLLQNIITKMTKEDKNERYQSLKQILLELNKAKKLTNELAPYENLLGPLQKNYEFAA